MSALHPISAKAGTRFVLLLLLAILGILVLLILVDALSVRAAAVGAFVCKITLAFLGAYVSLTRSAKESPYFFVALFVFITSGALVLDYVKSEVREAESSLEEQTLRAKLDGLQRVSENIHIAVLDIKSGMVELPERRQLNETPSLIPQIAEDVSAIKKQTAPEAPRRIPVHIRGQLIQELTRNPARASVAAIMNDPEAYQFATDWYRVLKAARWEMQDETVRVFMSGGMPHRGILLKIRGERLEPAAEIKVPLDSPLGVLGKYFQRLEANSVIQREPNLPEGVIRILVGPRPDVMPPNL